MKKLIGIFTVTLVMFLSSLTASAQELSSEQSTVWEISNKMFSSWQEGNYEEFAGFIHKAYQGWSVNDSIPLDKDQMIERFKKASERYIIEVVYRKPVSIIVSNAAAMVDYHLYYKMTSRESKDEVAWLIGKNAEFFVKEDGNWILLGDMTDFVKKEAER